MIDIWLTRHGKSVNPGFNQRDHERELNERGHADGATMAQWLGELANRPNWIWASDAVRAQQTAAYVSHACGQPVVTEAELYLAGPEAIMQTLRTTPADATSACVVAHNPGLTVLTNLLAGEGLMDNLPTWGCVHFRYDGEWPDLPLTTLTLVEWASPKSLRTES
ncbi:MAG: histidine phosphatase family protein [Pseudomonadota bacterium]